MVVMWALSALVNPVGAWPLTLTQGRQHSQGTQPNFGASKRSMGHLGAGHRFFPLKTGAKEIHSTNKAKEYYNGHGLNELGARGRIPTNDNLS